MLTVNQEWDPLKVCVVGRSYPPEFFSFMKNRRLRNLFEQIAIEVEEDKQKLISILKTFNIDVLRPRVPLVDTEKYISKGISIPPAVSAVPRDQIIMIGDKFFSFPPDQIVIKQNRQCAIKLSLEDIKKENLSSCFDNVFDYVESNGNKIIRGESDDVLSLIRLNGIWRTGKDILFGSSKKLTDFEMIDAVDYVWENWLRDYSVIPVTSGGHTDGCFNPVKPGLIFSVYSPDTYSKTFPGWEVIYFKNSRLNSMNDFLASKKKNHGKWYMPRAQDDDELVEYVEKWMNDWSKHIRENIFDVNILTIDEKNVIVSSYNKQAFDAFEKHGIVPHISPLRHRFFFDGGIHCNTTELHRGGSLPRL